MRKTLKFVALIGALSIAPALAQGTHHQGASQGTHHGGHMMNSKDAAKDMSPSSEAYRKANEAMHKDMDITLTGDSDADFVRGMIPHHRGAVDMAMIVLKYGKDPEIKKLATEIVEAQEKEIAFMEKWLKTNGK
jgi:uncharacterized protein (DUF305 family)